jgi:dihydrofolate reductase
MSAGFNRCRNKQHRLEDTMGTIQIDLFTTLDLVGQAPGGPGEDPEGGFAYGGWQAPLSDETVGKHVGDGLQTLDALLLGRRTYDIFAGYWPDQEEGVDGSIATLFNKVPKYVASRGNPELGWAGSTQLGPDLVSAVRELRDKHENVRVIGSLNLVQTLLRERLFDQLNLWIYPIVLGAGKKVFDDGAVPASLELREPPVTSPTGAVLLRYGLRAGTPATGDMTREDRGVPEAKEEPGRGDA